MTDAVADEGAATANDPYAGARANLRDTIKWLAATFAALAAVVLAGSPVAGLGKLNPRAWQAYAALFVLAAAFTCICLALRITLRLLRNDVLYLSDLDPGETLTQLDAADRREILALRGLIDRRAADVLPPNYPTLAALMTAAQRRKKALVQAAALRRQAPDDAARAAAEQQVQWAQQRMNRFYDSLQSLLWFGSYARLYERVQHALPSLFALGIGALVSLTGFAWLLQTPAEAEKTPARAVTIVQQQAAAERPPMQADYRPLPPVQFALGRAQLDAQAWQVLNAAREALRMHPEAVLLLRAYTDTLGPAALNSRLARQRADAVRDGLLSAGGVAPARIWIAALPETDLPVLTPQETAEPQNRRVWMRLVAWPP